MKIKAVPGTRFPWKLLDAPDGAQLLSATFRFPEREVHDGGSAVRYEPAGDARAEIRLRLASGVTESHADIAVEF